MLLAGSDHVGFQKAALPEDVVFLKSLDAGGQNALSDLLASFDGVVAVSQNFRLHDRHQTVFLTDFSITRQTPSIFENGLLRRQRVADLQNRAPLSETTPDRVVLLAEVGQRVETLGPSLLALVQVSSALVDLDSGHDAFFLEHFDELSAGFGFALRGFGEHDHARNELLDALGFEEELSVSDSVVEVVFDLNLVETLADCSS